MTSFVISFLLSLLATLIIIRYAHHHAPYSVDHDLAGVQKFHHHPVPRIGGLAIIFSAIITAISLYFRDRIVAQQALLLLSCALPAFAIGLLEDVTKRIPPWVRLLFILLAALLACLFLNARIIRIDVEVLDSLIRFLPISIVLTLIAVTGLSNAMNIIDGFNGLSSVVAIIMFGSLAYVGLKVQDAFIFSTALIMIGSILGFLSWNYPRGLIFLGDGGAYFIGFVLAELVILLVIKHPQVSAWYPLLMLIYPSFETLFSMYRRYFVRGMRPDMPDPYHLHTLIYRRVMRWAIGSKNIKTLTRRNSLTSPYLWVLCLAAVIPATLFWDRSVVLQIFCVLFIVVYVWLYTSIVRFRTPRWLVIKKRKTH